MHDVRHLNIRSSADELYKGDEVQRRIVSVENLLQSWWAAFDHDKTSAAGTAASTEESSLVRDLCRARVGSGVVPLNGLELEKILLARA